MIKVLVVSDSLNCHGAAKSLVNFLSCIDKTVYSVDLFLFSTQEQQFELPAGVNLLPIDKGMEAYFLKIGESIPALIKSHSWNLLFYRFFNYVCSSKETRTLRLQKSWEGMMKNFQYLPQKYDVAISYQDVLTSSFVLEKVHADSYVTWNHNPVDTFDIDICLLRETIKRFDHIVVVSQQAKESLVKNVGIDIAPRVILFPNLQNEKEIQEKAQAKPGEARYLNDKRFKILSVGRLTKQKGFDFAIKVANELKKSGAEFSWYIIGEGDDRKRLEAYIADCNLQDCVFLLGQQENPYAYMACCSLYAQPSRWEAEGITVKEAIILRKCVLATLTCTNGLVPDVDLMVVPFEIQPWKEIIAELIRKPEKIERFCEKLPPYPESGNANRCDKLLQSFAQNSR